MLARLPANQFVMRQNGDVVHFVYADPLVCGCLYVGTQQTYDQYKANQLQQHLADEQSMTAQTYSDAAWNWNSWGPWGGPVGPVPGFVYGPVGWCGSRVRIYIGTQRAFDRFRANYLQQ